MKVLWITLWCVEELYHEGTAQIGKKTCGYHFVSEKCINKRLHRQAKILRLPFCCVEEVNQQRTAQTGKTLYNTAFLCRGGVIREGMNLQVA